MYIKTSLTLITRCSNLTILKLVEMQAELHPELPSWVPDFRSSNEDNHLYQTLFIVDSAAAYNASGNRGTRVGKANARALLMINGLCVGRVITSSNPIDLPGRQSSSQQQSFNGGEWETFAHTCAQNGVYQPTGETMRAAYMRLRVGDIPDRVARYKRQRQTLPNEYLLHGRSTTFETAGLLAGEGDDY